MGIFRKANRKLEGAVEGAFGRAFKSSVQPVELAHKLAKEMGEHKTVGVSNVYVPNEFDVYLGKDDYDHLVSFEDSLKTELSNYVTAFARREGWTLVAPPRIELHCDDDLRVGEFGIATRTVSAPAEHPDDVFAAPAGVVPPAAAVAPGPVIDQTVLYQEPAPAAAPAPRASSARGVLRGRQGDYQLTGPVTVLGRSRRCDIVLTDPNVSRQHAEIRKQDDGFMLLDLGSTNGPRVNRRDVKQVVLQHGDRIELGTTEFLFERQP
jgi:hypothetical protein